MLFSGDLKELLKLGSGDSIGYCIGIGYGRCYGSGNGNGLGYGFGTISYGMKQEVILEVFEASGCTVEEL